jgi:hypothetical protein
VAVTEKAFAKKMNFLIRKWTSKRNQLMEAILMKLVGVSQV